MAGPTVRDSTQPQGSPATGQSFFLVVLGPQHTETRLLPPQGTLSIGRGEDADVRLVDALASRAHSLLHVGERIELEDLGSANGTRLRDKRIPAHQRITVSPGEAMAIGTTILVVQQREPTIRPRRIWPHGYFEIRLIETCAQATAARSTFALVRLHVDSGNRGKRCEELMVGVLRPGDLLASYGQDEYEILLVDTDRKKSEELTGEITKLLNGEGLTTRPGMAFFPEDGTSPDALVGRACQRLRSDGGMGMGSAIVVENPAMRDLYALTEKAARGTINILILGETGVGKEILAQTVHRLSLRAGGPFVCLNCAALSDTLLESELFGYEKGAFTGADRAKPGLLEAASSGTLFLDEIGEMPLSLQAKVLRAIETKQVMPVGATKHRPVDVRFVAATNRDLDEEIGARRFRQDLYFRLNGITLSIPPLRERVDEIPALAKFFVESAARQASLAQPRLAPEVLALLCAYSWPGNIRELRNVMERALLLSSGGTIAPEHLPLEKITRAARVALGPAANPGTETSPRPGSPPPVGAGVPLNMIEIEKQAILDALFRCAGNQTRAAELLGIPRRTFCKKLNDHNIPRPRV
jgi:two-component system response regulator AtoC